MSRHFFLLQILIYTTALPVFSQKDQPATIIYKTEKSIPYYDEATIKGDDYRSKMCVLDLYYPTNIKDFPTIVWFHGGGLKGGKLEIPDYLKDRGLAIIGVEYRLSPHVKVVDCIKDAAAATAWAFNHIEDYGGSTDLVFVSGMSAGGYLTYMIGLDKKYLASHDIDANQIAGLIPFSGHAIAHFTDREERGIPKTQPIVDEMAPLYHVRADAPPMLIITGDRELEMLGRYEENAYMMRMMKVAGHQRVRIFELDGSNHGQMKYPALPLLYREVKTLTKEIKEGRK